MIKSYFDLNLLSIMKSKAYKGVNFEYYPIKKPSKKIPHLVGKKGGICKVLNTGKIR